VRYEAVQKMRVGPSESAYRSRMNREVHVRLCVQFRVACSAGVSPRFPKYRRGGPFDSRSEFSGVGKAGGINYVSFQSWNKRKARHGSHPTWPHHGSNTSGTRARFLEKYKAIYYLCWSMQRIRERLIWLDKVLVGML